MVLADHDSSSRVDAEAAAAVPASVAVVRDYSRRAARTRAHQRQRPSDDRAQAGQVAARWVNPEWIPLGAHSLSIPHAVMAGCRLAKERACRAVMVNADPYAAALVGRRIAWRTRLPLVLDLRDPWAPCELRRPRRPAWARRLEDRLERRCVEQASAVVLSSATARAAYVAHYSDLDADRFHCVRNAADAALMGIPDPAGSPAATPRTDPARPRQLLFLGGFRRFLPAEDWLAALLPLNAGDTSPIELVVAGWLPPSAIRAARRLGVRHHVRGTDPVSHTRVGELMESVDVLLAQTQPGGQQRLPAKLFDYLATTRPVVLLSDSDEARDLAGSLEGVWCAGTENPDRLAAAITEALGRGTVPRRGDAYSIRHSARALAAILDQATG